MRNFFYSIESLFMLNLPPFASNFTCVDPDLSRNLCGGSGSTHENGSIFSLILDSDFLYVFNFKSITLVGIRIRIHSGKNVMNGRQTFRDSMRLKSPVLKTDPIWTRIHNCSRTLLVVPILLSQSQDFLSHERLYVLG